MQETLLHLVVLVLFGIAACCLFYSFFNYVMERYFGKKKKEAAKGDNVLVPLLAPLSVYFMGIESRSGFVRRKVLEYRQRILEAGGFWNGLNAHEVLSAQFTFAILVPLVMFLSGIFLIIDFGLFILFAIVFAIIAYFYPESALKSKAKKRQQLFMKQLPSALDILRVAAEAGLDFYSSADYLVRIYLPGPVKDEMILFRREIMLGKSTGEALKNLASRVNLPEVTTVFVSLAQSIEMGTSITRMLGGSSEEIRRKRVLTAESEAQKAIVKITFPLLLLILPGVFIVLLAPIAKTLFRSFGFF